MVNWTEFENLPGSVQHNFETLCRALIRLHYGRDGQFAALANQPGVEFHLHLHSTCALGNPGRWYGWQCRWYDLPSGRALGHTRRKKIEEALAKSVKVLPDLTDWVLWTRYPLTKADQQWFYALNTKTRVKLRLSLWSSKEAEDLLSGEAEVLRRTYFGELVFTPAALAKQHELSVAPIRKRWLPEAHQTMDAERAIRRMLGEAASWDDMAISARRLLAAVALINKEPRALGPPLSSSTQEFTRAARSLADTLQDVHKLLTNGDLELLRQRLEARPLTVSRNISAYSQKLRAARLACGLDATNALADMRFGLQLLDGVDSFLGTRLVGVVADAGGGKTQLAAQLTAATRDRPAGILIHGRELHSGKTLNDLARTITIQGVPVPSMEALLAALDAAGRRARRRLPLVIDGLNEAEDPRQWNQPLASLDTLLQQFANILVVCTVRTGARRPVEREWPPHASEETPAKMDFANQALPDGIRRIEIPDFGGDTIEAIRKYFHYFRINPGDAELPFELLSHPLTLRIFCEVTNPERKREVGIEAMPNSLTGLFECYLTRATERIGQLAPRNHRYYDHDIRGVLDVIGMEFWEKRKRELPEQELRMLINDQSRPWNESIIHMLEQEGVILRIPGKDPSQRNIIPVYDALGGYLIANAIVTRYGRAALESWLRDPVTITTLNGNDKNCHPLAFDIFRALVGLLPRRLHWQQLWQLVDEPLRSVALQMAAALEGTYLDAITVTAIADFVRQAQPGSTQIFRRLFNTRAAIEHPLNAEFLDAVLRAMPVGERDLHWTEWVRENREGVQNNLLQLEQRWQKNIVARTPSERLRAKWIMWVLTTTVHNLRDRVTRALYWFGRGDPATLFELTEKAADINDPYVFERMLAASYGVAMAAHCDSLHGDFCKTSLPENARQIFDLMFKKGAPGRTTHVLTREYGRRFIELASLHNGRLFSTKELARVCPPFLDGGRIAWEGIEAGEDKIYSEDSPFRMDFENYTLGRLAEGRSNYDYKHAGYRKIRAQVLWRVQQLGWTPEKFQRVDRAIEEHRHYYSRTDEEHEKIDRYGKKYSLIAYFELGGWLKDQGLLSEGGDDRRSWDLDIDPSFPSPTPECQLISVDLLGDQDLSLADWIKKGQAPDFTPYLRQRSIRDEAGPWVALDAYVSQQDESRGQRLIAHIKSFLVSRRDAKALAGFLAKQSLGERWPLRKPQSDSTFAGEIPWCDAFRKNEIAELKFVVKEHNVKVRRKRPLYFLDGKPIHLTTLDLMQVRIFGPSNKLMSGQPSLTKEELARVTCRNRMVEVEEVQQEFRKFRALIPVHDLNFVGRNVDNVSIHGITLAKQLAKSAALVHLPQTFDLQTKNGVRATYGIAVHGQDFANSQRFFFIREQVLRTIIRKHQSYLVWAVRGERELSYKKMLAARSGGEVSQGNFQSAHLYK
jgi:hypothetical protein